MDETDHRGSRQQQSGQATTAIRSDRDSRDAGSADVPLSVAPDRPRQRRTLADVRTPRRLWAAWRRGLVQGGAWPVVLGAPSGPDDPPTPAG